MAVTFLIIGVSLFLFFYWFRYTVILILRTRSAPEYARKVAAANRLSFVDVREKLHTSAETAALAGFCRALEQDYQALKYLLGHAATVEAGCYTAEQRLLMLNFGLMRLWCKAALRLRPAVSRGALLEMSSTLEYFANAMGRRFASLSGQAARA
jgi:hypothetical protein